MDFGGLGGALGHLLEPLVGVLGASLGRLGGVSEASCRVLGASCR